MAEVKATAGDSTLAPSPTLVTSAPALVRINVPRRLGSDFYHYFLVATWRRVLIALVVGYLLINTVFALGYLACGDGIENARHGSFADAFFFSVQTMSTIGYGRLVPRSIVANLLVTVEALTGLLGVAIATGLMFAKFARPSARVLFSKYAVITPRDGVPSLMFRTANERSNQIVEAQLHVVLLRNETTKEGEFVRRFYDLKLVRNSTVAFTNTWTAIHPIDESSPLFGQTREQLAKQRMSIVVSLMGFDETFSQTVHARSTYDLSQLRWDARLADILMDLPDGRRAVDYSRFHDVVETDRPAG